MKQEAITSDIKKIFSKFKDFDNFYLAGGTALALQLGHRISVDLVFLKKRNSLKIYLRR